MQTKLTNGFRHRLDVRVSLTLGSAISQNSNPASLIFCLHNVVVIQVDVADVVSASGVAEFVRLTAGEDILRCTHEFVETRQLKLDVLASDAFHVVHVVRCRSQRLHDHKVHTVCNQ